MKILMVNSTFFPDRVGGAELHTLWLARQLQRMGHAVKVVCGGAVRIRPQGGLEVYTQEIQGVPVIRLGFPASAGVGGWGVHHAVHAWAMEFLESDRPDIVHFGLFWDLIGIADASTRLGIPYAVTAHLYSLFCHNDFLLMGGRDICDGFAERRKCRRCLKRAWSWRHRAGALLTPALSKGLRDKLELRLPLVRGLNSLDELFTTGRAFARAASVLIAPTGFVRRELLKNGHDPDKVIVIPYGLPPHVFGPVKAKNGDIKRREPGRPGSGAMRFVVLSRLSPEKGLLTLIKAFGALNHGSPAELYIHGDGPADYVRRLRAFAGTNSRIHFRGPVDHERIPEVLSGADVMVVPSEWKEVSGIVAREALAVGVPVVATDIGGLPEAVRHDENGLLVRPADPQGLGAALKRFLDRRAPLKPISEEHRGIFTIEENAAATVAAFSQVLRGA